MVYDVLYNVLYVISSILFLLFGIFLFVPNYARKLIFQLSVKGFYIRRYISHLWPKFAISDGREIIYTLDNKQYRILPLVQLGIRSIVKITGENEEKTKILAEYLGPYRNFHGLKVTPKMMGMTSPVTVQYADGRVITYQIDQFIITEIFKRDVC